MKPEQSRKTVPQKSAARSSRELPRVDYSDKVTDEHIARIKNLVPETDYEGGEVVCGPAW